MTTRRLWQLWWLSLAVKIAVLPFVPVTPDEAYYFAWARHLDFSYLDHPPFVAWIMALGIPLWKSHLVRLPGVLLCHLGFIPWFKVLQRLGYSTRAQAYWMFAVLLGPLTGLGSFIVTPDTPLMFFWSLAIFALLWTEEKPNLYRWGVLGAIVGLGLLSKYMMILFFPATLVWLLWSGRKSELETFRPWFGLLISALVFFPVIYWNMNNGFASFLFQTKHGLVSESFRWRWPLEFMGSQVGLVNPLLLITGLWVLRQKPWVRDPRQKILVVFSAVPFIFFVLTSFRSRAEANWAVCSFPAFLALTMWVVDQPVFPKWRTWVRSGLALAGLFIALIVSHTIHPWLPLSRDKDHTYIMREWSEDVQAVSSYHPLYARSYQMAAFHSFYRPKDREVFKLAGLDRIDFYDFLSQSRPQQKGFVILKKEDRVPVPLLALFEFQNPRILPSGMVLFDLIPRSLSASFLPRSQP